MRLSLCSLTALLLIAGPLTAQSPRPASTDSAGAVGLTLYQDGRVLVRRSLPVRVQRGRSTVQARVGSLDPSTLFAVDSGTVITGFQYDGGLDAASAFRRAVGRRLRFVVAGRPGQAPDTITATVLQTDPPQLRLADGSIVFDLPGQVLFPPDLVPSEPTAVLSLQSAAPRDSLRLAYFTEGARWDAAYDVVLGSGSARVAGKAAVTSSSIRASNAQVQLLAGQVASAGTSGRDKAMMALQAGRAQRAAYIGPAAEERVGEFHLYSVPGRLTLLPGTTTSAALFEPTAAPYQRRYVVHGDVPIYGPLNQHPGDDTEVPVEVTYVLTRKSGTRFGDLPLPGGVARIYQADSAGRLQLVGESTLGHTAAGQELRLAAGNAFDLTARRVQTDYRTARDSTGSRWWTTATAAYRVTVSNATDTAATVEVREERYGEWKIVSSTVPAEKVSSSVTRFLLRVPARGEAVLRYTVEARW